MKSRVAALLVGAVIIATVGIGMVTADGTEALGPASIPIASGTGVVSAGTGMITQPGTINISVPAGATVEQVLLYWEGFMATGDPADDTITVTKGGSSNSVTGTLIGGPTEFFGGAWASVYRADITSLGVIVPGANTLSLSDMNFTAANNGAGVIVIFDDGSSDAGIQIRDGSDLAFFLFNPPLDTTVAQTFTFAASNQDRTANLDLFFASVAGDASGFGGRPTALVITTNGPSGETTVLDDLLNSNSGDEFDAFRTAVDIPAGATELTVQALSVDNPGGLFPDGNLPASFDWLAAAFSIESEEPPDVPGRMTGGGSVFTIDDVRVTRGFQIHCDLREPNNLEVNWPGNKFHLTELTAAVCLDTAANQPPPNSAPFDTFIGEGVGKLNQGTGRIEFTFVDDGEPGTTDTALIEIFDSDDNLVLTVSGFLDRGNVQAHKDNPPPGQQ